MGRYERADWTWFVSCCSRAWEGNPPGAGEGRTKTGESWLESSIPGCREKPRAVMMVWCPYRKPTLVDR
jgi:hypothetical protein